MPDLAISQLGELTDVRQADLFAVDDNYFGTPGISQRMPHRYLNRLENNSIDFIDPTLRVIDLSNPATYTFNIVANFNGRVVVSADGTGVSVGSELMVARGGNENQFEVRLWVEYHELNYPLVVGSGARVNLNLNNEYVLLRWNGTVWSQIAGKYPQVVEPYPLN